MAVIFHFLRCLVCALAGHDDLPPVSRFGLRLTRCCLRCGRITMEPAR